MANKTENLTATIKFDIPYAGTNKQDIASFIVDALETWGGQRHPDDDLFNSLSIRTVKIGQQVFHNPKPKEF